MTVPGRGNGLVAASYAPLVDLPSQLADQMLDELRDAGIAAYAAPAPAASGPYLEINLLDRPVDRLYADRNAVGDAQAVLHRRFPEAQTALHDDADGRGPAPAPRSTGSTEDEIWAAIVAAWDDEPAHPVRPRPESDEDTSDEPRAPASTPSTAPLPRATPAEEHYVPPTPPPLPTADTVTRLAWIAVVSGPLFFLVTALLGIEVTAVAAFLGVSAFVGGFVTLVARTRDRAPAGDDPDDGAVV